jgi:hypothetical protein
MFTGFYVFYFSSEKLGTVWLIPKDAEKPVDGRLKEKRGNLK